MIELYIDFPFGSLCVDAYLWSRAKGKFIKATAVFDTGAHTTHIDTIALQNLGYDVENADESHVSTIGSKNIRINNIIIDNIKLGGVEIGAVLVNFSSLADINFPIILGLNIIKEFNAMLDFKNKIISMNPNFDINNKIMLENFKKDGSRFGMWMIQDRNIKYTNRTWIYDDTTRKQLEQAEQDKKQALENQKIEFAIGLLDILDVETIAEKSKLTIEKVNSLKKEYKK